MKQQGKTIDLLEAGTLLPPPADKCQQCAVGHVPEDAHDAQSMYYQYWFKKEHKRWPTWKDAVAHCSPERKTFWAVELKKHGVDIEKL